MMERLHSIAETARPQSQMGHARSHIHHRHISSATLPDTFQNSQSDTGISSKSQQRPKSRESTTSIQSTGAATHYQQDSSHPSSIFIPTTHQDQLYQASPEEMLERYGQEQFAQTQQYRFDAGPPTQQQSDVHQYTMPQANFVPGAPNYGTSQDHIQHSIARTGSFAVSENQSPAPEDSEAAENGTRRKKGSATSLANDAELRRLLQQNQGKRLKEVATEVQHNEGGGHKSEKAKQVFAMLCCLLELDDVATHDSFFILIEEIARPRTPVPILTDYRLQESCQRSNQSVRRDRVFERYTERCGDERVPVLNAASFGKLVRIIFPNVQTRRLGVRGESKYHYVDLSLVLSERAPLNAIAQVEAHTRPSSRTDGNSGLGLAIKSSVAQLHGDCQQVPVAPPDTAEFPPPSTFFGPQSADRATRYDVYPPITKSTGKLHCEKSNTSMLRIPTANMPPSLVAYLPSTRASLPATLTTYLGLPSSASHSSPSLSETEANIELPEIHSYLVDVHYDHPIADSLSSLYRSYCIMVIDSFRFCREKPFFHHHAAFNGTMTVPVSKLLAEPRLAPWIQECDMRMYKKMIRYISPLVTQVVPDPVWAVFHRVSTKLVEHLVTAFERKCPTHVVAAKVVPATRFCSLLKKLGHVNQAANNVAPLLSEERTRSHMWADMVTFVSPERLLDESSPSPECWQAVERILKNDMKELLMPLDDAALRPVETAGLTEWAQYFPDNAASTERDAAHPLSEGSLDRWIQWLERLPQAFDGHHPQCIIDWHTRFWDSILTQLGMNGAQSYQAWWFLKAFLSSMLGWMTQMEGLLLPKAEQRRADGVEKEKRNQDEGQTAHVKPGFPRMLDSTIALNRKRKRTDSEIGGEVRPGLESSSASDSGRPTSRQRMTTSMDVRSGKKVGEKEEIHEKRSIEELDRPPFELPSIESSASPPEHQAQRHDYHHQHNNNDDSGISLDADIEDGIQISTETVGASGDDEENRRRVIAVEKEKETQKRMRRDWGILSDPVDAMGDVVVI